LFHSWSIRAAAQTSAPRSAPANISGTTQFRLLHHASREGDADAGKKIAIAPKPARHPDSTAATVIQRVPSRAVAGPCRAQALPEGVAGPKGSAIRRWLPCRSARPVPSISCWGWRLGAAAEALQPAAPGAGVTLLVRPSQSLPSELGARRSGPRSARGRLPSTSRVDRFSRSGRARCRKPLQFCVPAAPSDRITRGPAGRRSTKCRPPPAASTRPTGGKRAV